MLEALVNQMQTMPLGEELHTICFTAFLIGGVVACCRRSGPANDFSAISGAPLVQPPLPPPLATHRPARIRRKLGPRLLPARTCSPSRRRPHLRAAA
jgi:hypothetical protein